MKFSFSTLNMLLEHPHCWINRQSGVKKAEYDFFKEGRDGHHLIQQHVCGKALHPKLHHIEDRFDVVEEKDFDERTHFQFNHGEYVIHGYHDGRDTHTHRQLEIKLSANPWSILKFRDAAQRKVYALSEPDCVKQVLITGPRDPNKWSDRTVKRYVLDTTDKDRKDAIAWIEKALTVFENGDFLTDLEDGRCTDRYCLYGSNCLFKQ